MGHRILLAYPGMEQDVEREETCPLVHYVDIFLAYIQWQRNMETHAIADTTTI